MTLLVQDFLRRAAQDRLAKPALICDGRACSFSQLDRDSDRIAAGLQAAGVRRGDRVVLYMDNSPELVTSLWGVLKAGAVFVILNPTTKAAKLRYVLEDCQAAGLIAHPVLRAQVEPAVCELKSLRLVVWTQGSAAGDSCELTWSKVMEESPASPLDPMLIDNDLCAIVYTSGSTGFPKGVMLTHRNVTNTAWAISTYLENVPEDVVICVLPLAFDYGLYQIITGARVGFTVVLERSFAYPYRILQRIGEHGVTGLPAVPTMFATLLQMAAFRGSELSSLRYVTNTGATFPPTHIRRLAELFPRVRIYSMYGLTECTRVSYLDPALLTEKIASVGKAMPNCEAYIVNERGERVGPGVVGELVVRGANVMRGYWGKPEDTAKRLRDGDVLGEKLLYTGDLFRMDEEGFLYFVGRKDDIFKCKGEKVSPREIENVLYSMDAVCEAAVVGVKDDIDGHAIKVVVVLRDGASLSEVDIRRHCRAHLEGYMVPKFVEIRQSLPKTGNGKIDKVLLV